MKLSNIAENAVGWLSSQHRASVILVIRLHGEFCFNLLRFDEVPAVEQTRDVTDSASASDGCG